MFAAAQEWRALSQDRADPPRSLFVEPYRTLRRDLTRAVRRACPPWLAQDADDLVQEGLLRLLDRTDIDPATLSAAYLRRIAHSVVVDEIRRRRRRPGDEPQAVDHSEAETADLRIEGATRGAIGDGIATCLARQNEDRRRALTLHLLGHSVPEAARLMGCDAKRAENLVYRGLAHLRSCLAELGLAP
jgi:RNA polymerase sigma-70 factor (ECF subfamily)